MKQKKHAQILTIFQKLSDGCKKPDAYLVHEVAQELNLDYELIQKYANKDKDLHHALTMCKQDCLVNIDTAFDHHILDVETMCRYSLENLGKDDPHRPAYLDGLKQVEKEKAEAIKQAEKVFVMEDNIIQEAAVINKDQPGTALTDDATMQACHETKELKEQERIKDWRKKQSETSTRFKLETNTTAYDAKTNKADVTITNQFDKDVEGNTQKRELWASTFFAATGSANTEFANLLFGQTIAATSNSSGDNTKNVNAVMGALLGMAPKDEYEGMLITRLIVLNTQSMNYMNSANASKNDKSVDLNINRATKLMRVYNETLETLNRYRRKGEQRVVVQHVNVNNGGQAIVTSEFNQQTQGGGNDKK